METYIELKQILESENNKWVEMVSGYNSTVFKVGSYSIKEEVLDNESPITTYLYYFLNKDEDWENFGYSENDGDIIYDPYT